MKIEKNPKKQVPEVENEQHLDAACKRFLGRKSVLAFILHYCVPEYRDYSRDEIIACIEDNDIEIGSAPVHRREPDHIIGQANEDSTLDEGNINFDVRFTARVPNGGETHIILNVEAQNKFNPGYAIPKRASYYVSRLCSSQKGTVWAGSNYGAIQKVYSIWLCVEPAQNAQGFINLYTMKEEHIFGEYSYKTKDYQDLNFIVVGLDDTDSTNEMVKALSGYFSRTMSDEEKMNYLKDAGLQSNFEKEDTEMCNYSQLVKEAGRAEGKAEGVIKTFAENISTLMEKKGFSFEEAAELLSAPAEQWDTLRGMIAKEKN